MRTVVITGASRGLGLASALHLHRKGWHVVAAMRSVEAGLKRLRTELGTDARLTGVPLDLCDSGSITRAAKLVLDEVGAPDVVVHNAGITSGGCVEDVPMQAWRDVFDTNVFGPVQLTNELLPAMREARSGRIVYVSSVSSIRGMATSGPYGASKAAAERWAQSLAQEIAPFGLGVTVLVSGSFATDIFSEAVYTLPETSAYPIFREAVKAMEALVVKTAKPPERFAAKLDRAVCDDAPYVLRPVGPEAHAMRIVQRVLPERIAHHGSRALMGTPRANALVNEPTKEKS